MADQPTPQNQPASPDARPPMTVTRSPAVPPTQQAVTPPVTQPQGQPRQSGQPDLEVTQTAETMSALNALFEETAPPSTAPVSPTVPAPGEQPAAAPTGEPPKPTPVGTDDFSKKIDGVNAPPGSHPNVQAGINQLKQEALAEHTKAVQLETQLKEYQNKVTEYEAKLKDNKLPEPVEKELNALRERVREIDYQSDPDFQKNYVQPVQRSEGEILGLLKQAGLKDEHIKQIQENGGIIAMSQSNEPAGLKDKPDMTQAEWVESMLLAKTPTVFKNRILAKLANAQDLIEKGNTELADFKANAPQRQQQKMQQLKQDFEEGQRTALAELGDLVQPKTIPATASPEERSAIEAHNALLKSADEAFQKYLTSARDPKTAARILVKATQADVLLSQYKRDQATIKELNDRLNGIKAAGSHSTAGSNTPPPGPTQPDKSALLHQSTEQALGGLLNSATTP